MPDETNPVPAEQQASADAGTEAKLQEEQRASTEADAAVMAARGRIVELEAALAERDNVLADRQAALVKAVNRYREMAIARNPFIPAEMVNGATIEEVDASIERSAALVERVRQSLTAQATVPAGAPARQPVSLEGLTPGEKIRLGVKGK